MHTCGSNVQVWVTPAQAIPPPHFLVAVAPGPFFFITCLLFPSFISTFSQASQYHSSGA